MGMQMPGETWAASAATFLRMWTVMTAAMMLPSLVPMLVRFRRDLSGVGALRAGILTMVVAAGYFVVWLAIGVLVWPLTPLIGRLDAAGTALLVAIAIAYQWTPRKARDLSCCRQMLVHASPRAASARSAWHQGVRYGVHCARCCWNLMAIPVVLGTMNPWVMVLVGAAIAAERVTPGYTFRLRAR